MYRLLLRLTALVAVTLSSSNATFGQATPALPTILIPGILGSKLCSSDQKVVWGTSRSLTNLARLELSKPGAETLHACGLVEDIQVLGPFYSVKAYTGLREDLTGDFGFKLKSDVTPKAGAEGTSSRDPDLFVFDYDWRLSITDNAEKLEKFVNDNLGPSQTFNILAHSMGGLISRIYIENTKQHPRVRKIVYLGTPFLGAVSTFGTLSTGWGGVENWLAGGTETIRRVALSWPGMLALLPRYRDCCSIKQTNGNYKDVDPFDAATWKTQQWLPALLQTGAGFENFKTNLGQAGNLTAVLQAPAAGVIEVKFAGDARDTQFVFTALSSSAGISPPGSANWHFTKAPGDGTVRDLSAARDPLLRSLEGALQSFAEHATIFDDKWVKAELKRELTVQPADTRPAISGSGHPEIQAVVNGESRMWELGSTDIDIASTYLELGSDLQASIAVSLSAAPGLKANAYVPVVQIRQGNAIRPLAVTDVSQQGDIDNRKLRFAAGGPTVDFSEGPAEVVVSFPGASPATSASEFVVLMRK
jgi:pimeloyl-ACP methyl ester carboxylesterase